MQFTRKLPTKRIKSNRERLQQKPRNGINPQPQTKTAPVGVALSVNKLNNMTLFEDTETYTENKPTKKEIKNYLINKYFGGSFMADKAKDIDFELEKGFEFGYKTFFGGNKKGITIIKKR